MSYKTKFFTVPELQYMAKTLEHEQIYCSASNLADNLSAMPGDKDHGAYGANIERKLLMRGVGRVMVEKLLTASHPSRRTGLRG